MSRADLLPEGVAEHVAVAVLRHLEWQSDSFSVVFLFADVGPAVALIDWLQRNQALQGLPIHRREAPERFVDEPEAWLDTLLAELPAFAANAGSLWALLHRHPSDRRWSSARLRFLARINERRTLLEQQLRRPLVLVLPLRFRDEARRIAPDLWHVRAFSRELAARRTASVSAPEPSRAPAAAQETVESASLHAYSAWQRSWAAADRAAVFLPLAAQAIGALLQAGRPADAMEVAGQADAEARRRTAPDGGGNTDSAWRDLSIALDQVGQVARAQGDWAQADKAYRESLQIRRELVERLGGTPESLRDVSVSLNNVGQVARAQGDWAQADKAYRESLQISRELVERLGGTPESLRDVSVSLNNVGQVAIAQGDWAQADKAYRESLQIRRELVERLGGTPESLRDVSVLLNNVGQVAIAQGDWAQADKAYRESLQISRELVERLGGTPESLRDVSVSLDNVGQVAIAQGDWAQADKAYRESLQIRRELVERLGGTPESLRDVSVSLNNVGQVAIAQGDWAQADKAYRESLQISRELVERLGGTPESLRDVSVSLDNVGQVARAQGDWAQADKAYRESLQISRELVERLGGTPESLDDLAVALVRNAELPGADNATLLGEARAIYERLTAAHPTVQRYQQALAALRASENAAPSSDRMP